MKMQRVSSRLLLLGALISGLLTLTSFASSGPRIVRISDLDGDVQIDHGSGYEKALRNMPIVQGTKLRTEDAGLAEVEFENGSAVRMAPNTAIEFPELALTPDGVKQSTIRVTEGTAYFRVNDPKHDQFRVQFAKEQADVKDTTDFRVDFDDAQVRLGVTRGDLQIEGPAGDYKATRDHTITFDLANQSHYELAKGVSSEPYDKWSREETQYEKDYGYKSSATGSFPYTYGLSDLNYYGDFFNIPGYGWAWQPAYMGANWDPFMNGAWSWYPGIGYTWISGYPWGWMPYRYGAWNFAPGWGWFWQPGAFYGWNAVPTIYNPPAWYTTPRAPTVVARGPAGHPTVAVTREPIMPPGTRIASVMSAPSESTSRPVSAAGRPGAAPPAKGVLTQPAKGTVAAIHGALLVSSPKRGTGFNHVMPLHLDAESRGMMAPHTSISASHMANAQFEGATTRGVFGGAPSHGITGMTMGRSAGSIGANHGSVSGMSASHSVSSGSAVGHASSSHR